MKRWKVIRITENVMNKKIGYVLSKGAKWWVWSLHGDLLVYEYGMVVPGGPYQHIQATWLGLNTSFFQETSTDLQNTSTTCINEPPGSYKDCFAMETLHSPALKFMWFCIHAKPWTPLHFYIQPFNFLAAKLCHLNSQMELTTLA